MIDCHHCQSHVNPVRELEPSGGFTETCPKCSAVVGKTQRVAAVASAPTPRVADVTDPVAVLRARLAAVESQLPTSEQIRALRRERSALQRALRALGVSLTPKLN